MKKVLLVLGLTMLVCIVASAAGRTEAAQPTFKLRHGHVMTPADPFHLAYEKWARVVAERTAGGLTIEVFPSAQLGSEEDVLEQMRKGANISWQTDPARLGNYVREFSVLYAPFFLDNLDEVKRLLDSKVIAGWIKRLEDEFKLKVISYAWVQGYRNVYANRVGKNPTEFRGMRIRTAPAPMWVATVNSLGVTAVALPFGELYNAIQTRVVDGAELPFSSAARLKIWEVAKNIIETQHIFQLNVQVAGADWFNKLPKDFQTVLVEECHKAGLEVSELLQRNAEADKQLLISRGMNYIPHGELDIEAFKRAGQAAYDAMGLNAAREAVYAELGKRIVR